MTKHKQSIKQTTQPLLIFSAIGAVLIVAAVFGTWLLFKSDDSEQVASSPNASPAISDVPSSKAASNELASEVAARDIPFEQGRGMELFQGTCAACHGQWAGGTSQGPPLLHPYYRPDHHADQSFYRAIAQGVRAHHWGFGDMPAQAEINADDAKRIVTFVRWLQRDSGLIE